MDSIAGKPQSEPLTLVVCLVAIPALWAFASDPLIAQLLGRAHDWPIPGTAVRPGLLPRWWVDGGRFAAAGGTVLSFALLRGKPFALAAILAVAGAGMTLSYLLAAFLVVLVLYLAG